MAKDWRSGLQGRLKSVEDLTESLGESVDVLESAPVAGVDVSGSVVRHASHATAFIAYTDITAPTAGKKVTITDGVTPVVYTFRAAVSANYDVKIEADGGLSIANLIDAINMAEAPGVGDNAASGKYKVPVANPYVSADVDLETPAIVFTALVLSEVSTAGLSCSTDEATFSTSGVFGGGCLCTTAEAGQLFYAAQGGAKLFVAVADSTPTSTEGIFVQVNVTDTAAGA